MKNRSKNVKDFFKNRLWELTPEIFAVGDKNIIQELNGFLNSCYYKETYDDNSLTYSRIADTDEIIFVININIHDIRCGLKLSSCGDLWLKRYNFKKNDLLLDIVDFEEKVINLLSAGVLISTYSKGQLIKMYQGSDPILKELIPTLDDY